MAGSLALNQLSRVLLKSSKALVLLPVNAVSNNRNLSNAKQFSTESFFLKSRMHSRAEQVNYSLPEKSLEEDEDMTTLHTEAMERWRQEDANLRAIMVMDDVTSNINNPSEVASERTTQVKALFEELIEDGLLDPRLLWTTSARD